MKYLLGVLVLLLGLSAATAPAEIYRWTDPQGRIHFGDSPKDQKAAKTVNIEVNTYHFAKPKALPPLPAAPNRRVLMYSAAWCGYCAKARAHFKTNNIPYLEHDIEKDAKAKQEYERFGGRGVPVIFIGQKRINGFNVASFSAAYMAP